jgi:hypothetical protein
LSSERSHEPAVSVAFLEEPLPPQRFSCDPIQDISIDLGANGFHEITGEAIARIGVNVQNADAGIKSERSGCQASLRFEYCIEIIQDCIGRIDREPRRSS